MGELLNQRRATTEKRTKQLQQELTDTEKLCGDKVCVYATGSFARGEASKHSDLDLFIVGEGTASEPALAPLDEILLKADLIEATRKLNIPDFSGGGEYLKHSTVGELVESLGTQRDDATNTFTARLLLLLESAPLLGKHRYRQSTEKVISAYWGDYQDHKNDFRPGFLANDILRMWRTLCVNYEARTRVDPPEKKAKRKLKNYKLKHSRLLSCYSALLYLLAVFRQHKTVSPTDAVEMIVLTPTGRLEWLLTQDYLADAHISIEQLIRRYEEFLQRTDESEEHLIEIFMDKAQSVEFFKSAFEFGDLVFEVLDKIGSKNSFHRLLVV